MGRFDYIWPLPGIVALHNHPARFEVLLRWLAGNIAEDIRRHKPRVIIRDASPRQHKLPPAFNAVEFLSRNPEFATAMQDYTRHETIANCTGPQASNCAYQLFYRNDTAE